MELGLKCHLQTWGNGKGNASSQTQFLLGCVLSLPRYREREKEGSLGTLPSSGDMLGPKRDMWLWQIVAVFLAHVSLSLGVEKVLLSVLAGSSLCSSVGTFLNRQSQGR